MKRIWHLKDTLLKKGWLNKTYSSFFAILLGRFSKSRNPKELWNFFFYKKSYNIANHLLSQVVVPPLHSTIIQLLTYR